MQLANTNNMFGRYSYGNYRDIFYAAMRDRFKTDDECWRYVNSTVGSKSELRLETLLNNTSNTFRLQLLENQSNGSPVQTFNTEVRLALQDNFLVTQYMVYVGFPTSNTDVTWKPILNPESFVVPAADQASFIGLFNSGGFSITVDKYVVSPYMGLLNHMYQGQTQQTAALGAGSPADEFVGSQSGNIAAEPNYILSGARQYNIQVTMPVALASLTNTFSRIGVIFRGLLIQNSTVIN